MATAVWRSKSICFGQGIAAAAAAVHVALRAMLNPESMAPHVTPMSRAPRHTRRFHPLSRNERFILIVERLALSFLFATVQAAYHEQSKAPVYG